jgi:hypothetical protein
MLESLCGQDGNPTLAFIVLTPIRFVWRSIWKFQNSSGMPYWDEMLEEVLALP